MIELEVFQHSSAFLLLISFLVLVLFLTLYNLFRAAFTADAFLFTSMIIILMNIVRKSRLVTYPRLQSYVRAIKQRCKVITAT